MGVGEVTADGGTGDRTPDDCQLYRCCLNAAKGDALYVIACMAGYDIRWLLRWVVFFVCLDPGALGSSRAPPSAICAAETDFSEVITRASATEVAALVICMLAVLGRLVLYAAILAMDGVS